MFEGAGMNIYEEGSDVGNYRIRTAFIDNNGNKIYLELGGNLQNCKTSKDSDGIHILTIVLI
ncbi:hypothetical protein Q5M85_09075 [Paraclostridium bifermentans]|nr:hypothetical protein [Paraclostridium bifermentans]